MEKNINTSTDNKKREKLNLSGEEGIDIIYGYSEDYKVIQDNIVSHGRWSVRHEIVIQRLSDGKYFKDSYSEGATEMQDESPYEYNDPEFEEVFPIEQVTIIYQ